MEILTQEAHGLARLLVALAIGLIVGFERGWHGFAESRRKTDDGDGDTRRDGLTVAGIRTFGLVGLLGGVVGMLGGASPLLLAAGLVALGMILTAGYVLNTRRTGDFGATTEIALLLVFALGALSTSGWPLEATIAAVVTAALLGFKEQIHATLGRLDRREMNASLQMLLIALVVLPLLPDEPMGPWDSLNPRTIGLLIMLIAGIGFAGYFAVRALGSRAGLLVTAAFGSLSSSTAVTVTFSRLARGRTTGQALLAAGIALACGAMAIRVLVEVAVVNAALLPRVLPGMLALALVPLLATAWIVARHGARVEAGDLGLNNPLELRQALIIGGALAVVFVLARGAETAFGDQGVYGMAFLSGLADVDAITLALADQSRETLDQQVAARGIVLAAITNTAVKAGIAAVLGGRALIGWTTAILLAAVAAAGATMPFT